MTFVSLFAIGTLSTAFLQSFGESSSKTQLEIGKSGKSASADRSHGCIAVLEWLAYFPERSGSTCGWPRSWKRRAPLSAYFNECVSGPCLPANGPCHGGTCGPLTATVSKK